MRLGTELQLHKVYYFVCGLLVVIDLGLDLHPTE